VSVAGRAGRRLFCQAVSPNSLAARLAPRRRPAALSGIDRYNPGIGRPLRLAGRRLDTGRIHRKLGDKA